ncbi:MULTISPECIES: hypothetical protein [Flavobacteriaceae]|uniref:hypothetical protein n=1 Tax=Flavobacteriaceae TaxID=49546 RepID=UPI0010AEA8CE|nr:MULTISPECIES: hypothetical protein [Flavobacteriaceae]NJB36634.1 hypothetical protein [Croceivirga sp. JEA036]TKD60926.1 hypothetical protein FBT53_11730 [Flavobacterium sp. ASW18X]
MIKTIDRLMQFIEHAGLSARQFDISIGASNGYTLRMRKNHASIGSDVIENIIKTYPQLNLIWLITGEGEMLNPEKQFLSANKLPKEKELEIERIIAAKIRERQEKELQELLREVNKELDKREDKD